MTHNSSPSISFYNFLITPPPLSLSAIKINFVHKLSMLCQIIRKDQRMLRYNAGSAGFRHTYYSQPAHAIRLQNFGRLVFAVRT